MSYTVRLLTRAAPKGMRCLPVRAATVKEGPFASGAIIRVPPRRERYPHAGDGGLPCGHSQMRSEALPRPQLRRGGMGTLPYGLSTTLMHSSCFCLNIS